MDEKRDEEISSTLLPSYRRSETMLLLAVAMASTIASLPRTGHGPQCLSPHPCRRGSLASPQATRGSGLFLGDRNWRQRRGPLARPVCFVFYVLLHERAMFVAFRWIAKFSIKKERWRVLFEDLNFVIYFFIFLRLCWNMMLHLLRMSYPVMDLFEWFWFQGLVRWFYRSKSRCLMNSVVHFLKWSLGIRREFRKV